MGKYREPTRCLCPPLSPQSSSGLQENITSMKKLIDLWVKIKLWISITFLKVNSKFQEQFGFDLKETTYDKVVEYLFSPRDSSSLAVTRILFGIAMLFDIPDERGGAAMDKRWGEDVCHFPLMPFLTAVPMPYMALVYAGLWLGALGIALGYKYRRSASLFTACYWYLLLIEKSYWNNHSYLFGLVALLIAFTDANCCWSLDAYVDPTRSRPSVPYWNYFILKYQFFILYFMAGLKKGTAEWLTGYSVQNLSEHWVFNPFKLFLTVPQTDFLIVHWFVFAFDLTVAMWMMWEKTRHVAMIFCALFHLMNSRLFSIGMFPWVCLATMPLFYPFDWPKTILKYMGSRILIMKRKYCKYICIIKQAEPKKETFSDEKNVKEPQLTTDTRGTTSPSENQEIQNFTDNTSKDINERKKIITFVLIVLHVVMQAFLPYSHFITKGYNNWTNGLYGYSWDMMVHTWDVESVVVKIVDNSNGDEFFVDPYVFAPNDRWTRHGDMVHQYANCLRNKIFQKIKENNGKFNGNLSIYIDVWCSMNGRFTQRMFDPKIDLLNVSWSVFEPVSYLMPLFDALEWRISLHELAEHVHSWNNYSDVIFIADFPGYTLEKYIPTDIFNVTVTILEGVVAYEPEVNYLLNGRSYRLTKGDYIHLASGTFHKILNVGNTPAYYMYTFANKTEANKYLTPPKPTLPITQELFRRFENMFKFAQIVMKNIFQLYYQ